MSGMTFFGTGDLEGVRKFYTERCGMGLWLEQGDCVVLDHGNMLLGFCSRKDVETCGTITLFYDSREEVDAMYAWLKDVAEDRPKENDKYRIHHFFARDPEGRRVEFQHFTHPVEPYLRSDEALVRRRSVRKYRDGDVPDEVLWKVMETCRYAPTSMNSESYYFLVIKDREKLEYLASLRGSSSAPVAAGPAAVAIVADDSKTKRPDQDGCIAAYHFLLAARSYGLGTCWIAAMDRPETKECLGIPEGHYVATITPLGWPAETPKAHERRGAEEMVRFL